MAGAVLQSPTHRGKQMKCFADMSKHDDDQTPGAEQHQIPTGSGVWRLHVCHLAAPDGERKRGEGWTYVQRPTGYSARIANPGPGRRRDFCTVRRGGCFVRSLRLMLR
jgi:hypothetical protein